MEDGYSQPNRLLKLVAWTIGLTLNGAFWGWIWIHAADYADYLHRREIEGALIYIPILCLCCFAISLPLVGRLKRDRILRLPAVFIMYPAMTLLISYFYAAYTDWPGLTNEELSETKNLGFVFSDEDLSIGGTYFGTSIQVKHFKFQARVLELCFRNKKAITFVSNADGFELQKEGCMVYSAYVESTNGETSKVNILFATQ